MYASEFRLNWQTLLAAAIGMGLGSALSHYTMSLFGPAMLREFGWSRADFALLGSIPLLTLALIPVAGRFTDRFGARISAMVGFCAVPLGYLAYTVMPGNIVVFFAIYLVQHVFGVLTTSFVFCRAIVERFDAARGIALSVLMTGPPLIGAVAVPLLGGLIAQSGWRAGYLAMAALTAMGGVLAVSMMGRDARPANKADAPRAAPPGLSRKELLALVTQPAFLMILGGMILVNLPQVFASSQLKLVVQESGVSDITATWLISLYAIGVVCGRFVCGFALDRVPPHIVAICSLGLPALGFAIFASSVTTTWLLAGGVLLVGMAQGAEGDIGAFLISRRFDMRNYSLLLSFLTAAIGLGAALGSLIMSFSLRMTGSYDAFLIVAAATTVLGAILFFMTGPGRDPAPAPLPAAKDQA